MTIQGRARRRPLAILAAAVGALLTLLAVPATAHVTANPGQVPAGEYVVIDLRVPHGCDGSATTAISVQIPDTIASVTPEFVPGWTVETTTGPLSEPVELHGEEITSGIREVTWSGGGPIPGDQYADFGLSVRTPEDVGATLHFPTVQTCESGETAWIEIPAEGGDGDELESPAPSVMLTDGSAAGAPVATTELTASGPRSVNGPGVPVAVVVSGLALLVAVAALVVVRRRSA